jgi:hypothetical protein
MSKKRLRQIEQQIEKIKNELQALTIVRPGSLTRQYRDPAKRSGGFYQLSYTHQMKSRTEYVRAAFVPEMRRQIREYKRLKRLIDRWVALGLEYSKLSMRDAVARADAPTRKSSKAKTPRAREER